MKKLRLVITLLLASAMLLFFVGCAKDEVKEDIKVEDTEPTTEDTTEDMPEATTPVADLTGSVAISGSTSVEKIGSAAAEEFMALNPGVTVTYEGIGSSAGIKNANENVTPLGTASRNLKEEEKGWGMEAVVIAYDGIAAITHPSNSVSALTKDQLLAIYKGDITNWSEVGGDDAVIVVVSREDGSGTRGAYEELLGFEGALTANALIAEGNGNVQTTVAGNPQAIGYVSLEFIDKTVKPLIIDEVEPTVDNVLAGTYQISRPFIMVYHEKNMTDATKAFIDFILSDDGQAIVADEGGIPIK